MGRWRAQNEPAQAGRLKARWKCGSSWGSSLAETTRVDGQADCFYRSCFSKARQARAAAHLQRRAPEMVQIVFVAEAQQVLPAHRVLLKRRYQRVQLQRAQVVLRRAGGWLFRAQELPAEPSRLC